MQIAIYIGQQKNLDYKIKLVEGKKFIKKELNWQKLGFSTKLRNRYQNTLYLIGLGQNHTGLFMKLILSQKLKKSTDEVDAKTREMTS